MVEVEGVCDVNQLAFTVDLFPPLTQYWICRCFVDRDYNLLDATRHYRLAIGSHLVMEACPLHVVGGKSLVEQFLGRITMNPFTG